MNTVTNNATAQTIFNSDLEFTVVSSNITKEGKFINKVQNKDSVTVDTFLGPKTSSSTCTLYLQTDKQAIVGTKGKFPKDTFHVVERPFTIDEPGSDDDGKEINLKWLHIIK